MEKINVIDLDTNTVIQTTRSELLSAHSSNLFDHTFYILFQTRWGLAAFSVCTVVFLLAVAAIFLFTGNDDDNRQLFSGAGVDVSEDGKVSLLKLGPVPDGAVKQGNFLPVPKRIKNPEARHIYQNLRKSCPALTEQDALSALRAAENVPDEDVEDFLKTGKSNDRTMQFAVIALGPSHKIRLHRHRNIELIMCVQGRIHEIRHNGVVSGSDGGVDLRDKGSKGMWETRTLEAGEFMVNEAGSVHASFTDVESGCLLFVLWGGDEGEMVEEDMYPVAFDVDKEVKRCVKDCCGRGKGLLIPEEDEEDEGEDSFDENSESEEEERTALLRTKKKVN